MSELQLGLVSLGLAILLGVLVYNTWQRFKVRRMLPRSSPAKREANVEKSASKNKKGRKHPSEMLQAQEFAWPDREEAHPWEESAEPFLRSSPSLESEEEASAIQEAKQDYALNPSNASAKTPSKKRWWWLWWANGKDKKTHSEKPDVAHFVDSSHQTHPADHEASVEEDAISSHSGVSVQSTMVNAHGQKEAHAMAGAARHDDKDMESDLDTMQEAIDRFARANELEESIDILNSRPLKNTPSMHIDERIDAVVEFALPNPLSAQKLIPLAQRLRRVGNKPVLLEAKERSVQRDASEGESAEHIEQNNEDAVWSSPQLGRHYQYIRMAVQLANRSGALNEIEFSEFASGVRFLAKTLYTTVTLPSMQQTVERARQLDVFASQCDMQLSINLMSDGAPWSAQYVQQTALQDGLVLSRDGSHFVKFGAHHDPIFMLYCGRINFLRDDLTYGGSAMITLLLDVPAAEAAQEPFQWMREYARALAKRIGGRIVDDQRKPLSDATLDAIDKKLMELYALLDTAGLPAGAPATRRLFSHG
jgi:hypothetical protein